MNTMGAVATQKGLSNPHSLRGWARLLAVTVFTLFSISVAGVAGAAPRSITLSEGSNGHLYSLHVGDKVTIVLHSVYWSFSPLTGPKYLAQVGGVTTVGSPPGTAGCVVGQGCGTVTVHYVAKTSGALRVKATRTTCGEALKCSASNSLWSVIFKVY